MADTAGVTGRRRRAPVRRGDGLPNAGRFDGHLLGDAAGRVRATRPLTCTCPAPGGIQLFGKKPVGPLHGRRPAIKHLSDFRIFES